MIPLENMGSDKYYVATITMGDQGWLIDAT